MFIKYQVYLSAYDLQTPKLSLFDFLPFLYTENFSKYAKCFGAAYLFLPQLNREKNNYTLTKEYLLYEKKTEEKVYWYQ